MLKRVFLVFSAWTLSGWAASLLPPQFVTPQFRAVRNQIVAAPPVPAIDNPPFTTPRGTGLDGVGAIVISTPSGSSLCSGSLLTAAGKPLLLTAAHCLADRNGVLWANEVDLYLFPNPTGLVTRTISEINRFFVHPNYDGQVISDFDIALISLWGLGLELVSGLQFYDLYGGPVSNAEHRVAGFGLRGDGNSGSTLPAGLRRQGFNQFDVFFSAGILLTDFDNGRPENDALALFGIPGLGLGAREAHVAPGDSGGPVFFGNQIVAVNSFIATLGSVADGGSDIDDELNSSFGEFGGFVYTGFHRDWVQRVALSIPEPATGMLVVLSSAVLWVIQRRVQAPQR